MFMTYITANFTSAVPEASLAELYALTTRKCVY